MADLMDAYRAWLPLYEGVPHVLALETPAFPRILKESPCSFRSKNRGTPGKQGIDRMHTAEQPGLESGQKILPENGIFRNPSVMPARRQRFARPLASCCRAAGTAYGVEQSRYCEQHVYIIRVVA